MDPFEALGLPRSWRLPSEQIRSAQRRVCAASHPDRFHDPAQRADAQARVALANQAAATLLEPLGCAESLLAALAPQPRPAEPRPSPMFLAEMIELRERLDAGEAASVASDLAALEQAAQADAEAGFERLLAGDSGAWNAAAEATGRLRAVLRARGEGRA
ncbi:MAG: iron-sulfur cluster co-chaperone HscB C-terminal domain-containing protein [Planctomycetota bacterium]